MTDVPYVAVAAIALLWLPAGRARQPLVCVALVVACALACSIVIPLPGHASASCVQLAFIPMLFLAPLNVVLLIVMIGLVAPDAYGYARHRRRPARAVLALGDSWFAAGPVFVLGLAGAPAFSWVDWPLYACAVGAQVAVSTLAGGPRERLHAQLWPAWHDVLWLPAGIDLTLTVPAAAAVAVARDAPVACALTTAALLMIARGFTSERRGRLVEHHHATHDPLTGLANRLLFEELATAAAARARRDGAPCAVLVADLNGFKAINDELGHPVGDRVLVAVAARLRGRVRAVDTVARLGGDEFAILLAGRQTRGSCDRVAAELRDAIAGPLDLPGVARGVDVSIGAALLDGDRAVDDVLDEADRAMYADKRAGAAGRP